MTQPPNRPEPKPYEPSECLDAFNMLRAVPSIEIPYPELCLRFVNLELQVKQTIERLNRHIARFEHDHDRINALCAMPHNKWTPDI